MSRLPLPGIRGNSDLRLALRDTFPVAMGYVPLGVAYGVLVVQSGLPWYLGPLSSLVQFAGAMQFLAIGLLAAHTPLPAVLLATFAVNFRHVFYGLSFPLGALDTPLRKGYGIFALTDETYSLLAGRAPGEMTGRRIHLVQLLSHGYWVAGGTIGAVAGVALPSGIRGIEFALTALFVVLTLEQGRRGGTVGSLVTGAVSSGVGLLVGGRQFLSVAMGTFLLLVVVGYLLRRMERPGAHRIPARRDGTDGDPHVPAPRGPVSGAPQGR